MVDINKVEKLLTDYCDPYHLDIDEIKSFIRCCKRVFRKSLLNNVYMIDFFDISKKPFNIIMFDEKSLVILKSSESYYINSEIIPIKNITKVNYSEEIYINGNVVPKIDVYSNNEKILELDAKYYYGKKIFDDSCEFIREFIKQI